MRHNILEFLREERCLLNPYRNLEEHIRKVQQKHGCPCRPKGHNSWRPICPCKEATGELARDGMCCCTLFITDKVRWDKGEILKAQEYTKKILEVSG